MTKWPSRGNQRFGTRLAALRKGAGLTQQQLADRVGTTRRVIAYYESESEHPPTGILVNIAGALRLSTDALLGLEPMKSARAERTISPHWERRVRQIEDLGHRPKKRILTFIDAIITAESTRHGDKP